jgi:O-antigen ligase
LLVFLLLEVISILFSQNIYWSIRKLAFSYSIFPIYFFAVSILNTYQKKRTALLILLGSATILAIIAILQFISQFIFGIDSVYAFLANTTAPFFLGKSFSASVLAYPSWLVNSGGTTYMRATATFPDPHMLSYYFGMLIPWSIALWSTTIKHKKVLSISVVLLLIADALTFTRGGYLALIAGALIILPLVSLKTAKKIIMGCLVFILLFTIAPHNPVAGRLVSSFDTKEGSNQARMSNWQQAITIISSKPFGVGIGNYSLAVNPTATYREPIYAHNAYLDIAAEIGIPAAIIFILLLFLVFKSFWLLSKKQPFFIAGASSVAIFSFHSLVENPLYSVHVLPLFLIIIALSTKTIIHEKDINN